MFAVICGCGRLFLVGVLCVSFCCTCCFRCFYALALVCCNLFGFGKLLFCCCGSLWLIALYCLRFACVCLICIAEFVCGLCYAYVVGFRVDVFAFLYCLVILFYIGVSYY